MEGIHDRPRAGEFFSGCAFEPGESIHRDDLNTLTPRVGLGGQPGFEDPLGAARDHIQEPGGTTTVSYRSHVQDDGDVPVPVRGVPPHVFINANDTHPFTPCWIIDQQAHPFGQDSSVRGSSRTRQGPGRRASPSDGRPPGPSAPSAPPHARAWHADRPLDSCLDATPEHTPGTASGTHSQERLRSATRRARAPYPALQRRNHQSSPVIQNANASWAKSVCSTVTSNPNPSRRVNALRLGRTKVESEMLRSFKWAVKKSVP